MQSAIVVGGSNGIGLALSVKFIQMGIHVIVLDREEPAEELLNYKGQFSYQYCDLTSLGMDMISTLSDDPDISWLIITAGFGRICNFEELPVTEIEKLLTINTLSVIKILRVFYHRIKAQTPFYCGIMGSIAGWVSSPMFSVYAASKAALCRFTESVNAELNAEGYSNRILNVSPGSIKGTKFVRDGRNDLSQLNTLASEIIDSLRYSEELLIPEYDTVYKDVLKRYCNSPIEFGVESYYYKKESGRADPVSRICVGYLSGTFDLFHVGHLNLLKCAKQQCDYLIVGVHPDASHKGKQTFIPFKERKAIVNSIRYVDKVVQSCPEDSDAWELWHYHKLFVGSDYKGTERFRRYEAYFKKKGVSIVYFPYTQGTSSTQIRELIINESKNK